MGRRQTASAIATGATIALGVTTTVHAPKMVAHVPAPADPQASAQTQSPMLAKATPPPPTPWPSPFDALADYADTDPKPTERRRPELPPKRARSTITSVRQPSPEDPTVAAATPYRLPGPIDIEPVAYTAPITPLRSLPIPLAPSPFVPPPLDAPQALAPIGTVSANPPTFLSILDGPPPIEFGSPTFSSPDVTIPIESLVSVPEPSTLALLAFAPLLLLGRRQGSTVGPRAAL